MKHIWYEVFKSHEKYGSETIGSFKTLQQAKDFKNSIKNNAEYKDYIIIIDKWRTTEGGCLPIKEYAK